MKNVPQEVVLFFAHLVTSNHRAVVDKGELECHADAMLLRRHLAAHCASHSCNFCARSKGIRKISISII